MAGQMVMQGFVGFKIPVLARRLITMIPAFVVVALGVNATDALVYSQVALSLALPAPMIAVVVFTGRRDIMGAFVNSPPDPGRGGLGDGRHPGAQRRAGAADLRRADPGVGGGLKAGAIAPGKAVNRTSPPA